MIIYCLDCRCSLGNQCILKSETKGKNKIETEDFSPCRGINCNETIYNKCISFNQKNVNCNLCLNLSPLTNIPLLDKTLFGRLHNQ